MGISNLRRYKGLIDRVSRHFVNLLSEDYTQRHRWSKEFELGKKDLFNMKADISYEIDAKLVSPLAFEWNGFIVLALDFTHSVRGRMSFYGLKEIDLLIADMVAGSSYKVREINKPKFLKAIGDPNFYDKIKNRNLNLPQTAELLSSYPAYKFIRSKVESLLFAELDRLYSPEVRANLFKFMNLSNKQTLPYLIFSPGDEESDGGVRYFSSTIPKSDKDMVVVNFDSPMDSSQILDYVIERIKVPYGFLTQTLVR